MLFIPNKGLINGDDGLCESPDTHSPCTLAVRQVTLERDGVCDWIKSINYSNAEMLKISPPYL